MPYANNRPVIKASFWVLTDQKRLIDGSRNQWVFATRQDALDFWGAKTMLPLNSAIVEHRTFSSRRDVAAFINQQIGGQING